MVQRTFRYVLAAALLALGGSASGGCSLVLGIHEIGEGGAGGSGGSGGGQACDQALQCVSKNICATSTCQSGLCVSAPLPDGPAPNSTQVAGNCSKIVCVAGVAEPQDDDQDIADDGEQCTVDACAGGKAFHTAKPNDAACTLGGNPGFCVDGTCTMDCVSDSACDDKNPCTQDTCDKTTTHCVLTPLDSVNTPGVVQVDGDCRIQVCVNGVSTSSPDDTDLPLTATPCDSEICSAGVPGNPPLAIDVPCSKSPVEMMYCDGAGACVQCNTAAQCGSDTDCLKRTCTAGACGVTMVPLNTPVAMQTPGDCHAVVCDGAGSTLPQPIIDSTDTKSDNNDCTKDLCMNGVVGYMSLPPGSGCGNGQQCNAAAQCGCSNDQQCTAPSTCGGGNPGTMFTCGCTKTSCALLGATCGTLSDACSSTLNCDTGTKNGAETDVDCGGGGACTATCGQGKQCNVDADCGSGHCADGVCCDTACNGTCVACTAAKKGSGLDGTCGPVAVNQPDNFPANTCVGPLACDGNKNCKKIVGQTCTLNSDCVSATCADGVCCGTVCSGLCQACSAAKKASGPDGVCGPIAANQPDTTAPQTCTGTLVCDGAGGCKKVLGQPCVVSSQCANNNCAEGVCCGVASCPACQSCAMGPGGTCGNLRIGPDNQSPNLCNSTATCDGSGNCKKVNGQTCGTTAECATGTCLDGVCCGVASCPTCQSCALSGNGTCSNIASGNLDSVPAGACTTSCDGMGTCKTATGLPCPGAGASGCQSGLCADGVCCSTVCDGSAVCMSCNGVTPGTCNTVKGADDPDSCSSATSTCDMTGSCLFKPGQPCFTGSQCASGICIAGMSCL